MGEEAPTLGPLDLVRDIEDEAVRYDALAQYHLERNPDDLDGFRDQVEAMVAGHPWLNQEVKLRGICLTEAIGPDGEEIVPYSLPSRRKQAKADELYPGMMAAHEESEVRGLYHGITVRLVFDPESGEQKYKAVHMINVGESGLVIDWRGDIHQTHYYNYVCVDGADGEPVLPLNGHSMEDLDGDPVVAAAVRIMGDGETTMAEKIRSLGEIVNEILAWDEIEFEAIDLNRQRASYLNSLSVHHAVRLLVNDMLVGAPEQSSIDFGYSTLKERVNFTPYLLDIAPGYDRMPWQEEPLRGGPPELYAQALVDGGRVMLAPLKAVLEVEEIRS